MNKKIAVYFMFCFCLFCEGIFAQVKENDSTTSIYQDIHDLSKKSKFNKFVYKLLFRSSALKAENLIPDRKPVEKPLITNESNGKIIRNIIIETLLDSFIVLKDTLSNQDKESIEKDIKKIMNYVETIGVIIENEKMIRSRH